MTKRMIFFATALGLVAVSMAHAQIDPGNYIAFDWGASHAVPGQATVFHLALNAQGPALTVQVQFELTDKNGNTLYRNTMMLSSGQAISLAVGPEYRTTTGADIRQTIPADIYAIIGPEIRTIHASLKITWPPGPTAPVDRLTPTMERMDVSTGLVAGFSNNPHTIIGAPAN